MLCAAARYFDFQEMDLLEGFFKFIKTQRLPLADGRPTLLTVSAGLDSVVLAHLFKAAKLPFAIAHCNFQLRGEASEGDEVFVQKIARDFGVPFFVKRFETKDYAEKNGLSTQMAARDLRYEWFAEIAMENGFNSISTAHHLNDSVETALLNFVRGTSLPGLSGIAVQKELNTKDPHTVLQLLRPLLFATRDEILDFAKARQIVWREDSSNASDDYARNFVRHHIVPPLETLNPNFLQTAARNMRRIRSADENLVFLLNQWLNINSQTAGQTSNSVVLSLEKAKLTQLPSPRQAIRQLLKPFGFTAEQTRQLAENLDHIGLELHTEKGFKVLVDREKILVSSLSDLPITTHQSTNPPITIHEDDLMVRLPDGSQIFLVPTTSHQSTDHQSPIHQSTDHQSITVDAEKLKFPLQLRHWHPGDSFQPIGMEGKSQKLQDYFTNQKLSRLEKEDVWLLINGDAAVVWVVGWRLDERFKIQTSTNKVLKINWIK